MEVDQVTAAIVEDFLSGLQQGNEFSDALFKLHLFKNYTSPSQSQMAFNLFNLLRDRVVAKLKQLREQEKIHIPDSNTLWPDVFRADFSKSNAELEAWSALYYRYFHEPEESIESLAKVLNENYRQLYRRVKNGLEKLVKIIKWEEMQVLQKDKAVLIGRNLPEPEFQELIGNRKLRDEVKTLLTTPHGPAMISLEGLGGIGKTSLGRAVAGELAEESAFEGIAWVSARHEMLNVSGELQNIANPNRTSDEIVARLAEQLFQDQLAGLPTKEKITRMIPFFRSSSHLVVIDNLETVLDVQLLIPLLQPLTGNTRFLLTSRQSLVNFPFVATRAIPELTYEESCALVQSELKRRDRKVELTEEIMRKIFDCIGGLPLALHLISAQITQLPVDQVLSDLHNPINNKSQSWDYQFYRYIYQRAWQLLDQPAQNILVAALLLPPEGGGSTFLRQASGLDHNGIPQNEYLFEQGVKELVDASLLNVFGSLADPQYRLHRITSVFLQTDILNQSWDVG